MTTILIVDDRAINRDFLSSLLGYSGYRVLQAADGAQALDVARAERPDLVIADVIMPVMDGPELLRQLHAGPDTTSIPVMFYTATFRSGDAGSLAKNQGVSMVLAKPSEPQAILEAVSSVLGRAGTGKAEPDSSGSPGEHQRHREPGLAQEPTPPAAGGAGAGPQALGMRIATLLELNLELAGTRDPAALLQMGCRGAQEIIGTGQVAIAVLDRSGRLEHLETVGLPLVDGRNLIGTPNFNGDALASFCPPASSFLKEEIRSSGRRYGWLYLAGRAGSPEFTAEDQQIAVTLAAQVGIAWENLTLYEELRQNRQAIQEREERLSGMIDAAMDAIITVDHELSIVIFNSAAEAMFRYRRDEMLGQPLHRLIPGRFQALHQGHIRRFGQTGVTSRMMGAMGSISGIRSDGLEFPIEASISRIGEGNRTLYTVILRDITERRQNEAALLKARDELELRVQERTHELEGANRSLQREIDERRRVEAELLRSNAELEQFAHVTSHDLQEPLRTVGSFVQLLSRNYHGRLDEEADRFIALAVEGVERMRNIIRDVLAYSKVQGSCSLEIEPVDSGRALGNALANLKGAIEASEAQVTSGPLPPVRVPSGQLTQLFQNLVGNALKFRGAAPLQIHVSAYPEEKAWLFQVRDNGIGIDPAYHERIFGMFHRLHSRTTYPGTGIGLALCKKIVECHGGRIWVESSIGQGSVFCFTLPR